MDRKELHFHDLYLRYADDVYRFAYWLSGSADDADDITAETFTRAWIARRRIRTETVKAYLLAIARNVFLQMARRRRREVTLETTAADPTPPPDKQIADRIALERVLAQLQTLPEADRAALLLRVHHELPYAEIARALQLTVSAAKVKVHRARLRLAALQLLEEVNEHGNPGNPRRYS